MEVLTNDALSTGSRPVAAAAIDDAEPQDTDHVQQLQFVKNGKPHCPAWSRISAVAGINSIKGLLKLANCFSAAEQSHAGMNNGSLIGSL
jgi:hypothetical protein